MDKSPAIGLQILDPVTTASRRQSHGAGKGQGDQSYFSLFVILSFILLPIIIIVLLYYQVY